MRRIFIILLLGLLAAVSLVALIETSPGYVLVSWGQTTLETSLWVGLFILLVLFLLVQLLARFWRRVRESGGSMAGWLQLRRESKGRRLTEKGMLAFAGGNWEMARRALLQAVPHLPDPTLNYLAAARASNKMKDSGKVRQYLDAATTVSGTTETVALTRAELLLENGEPEMAFVDLETLRKRVRRFPQILVLRLRACEALERWPEVSQLIPTLRKRQLLAASTLDGLEFRAHAALLRAAASGDADAAALMTAWSQCPDVLKKDSRMIQVYVPLLVAGDRLVEAEKLLVAALKREWIPGLVTQFGLLESANPARQLKLAESWLQAHDDDAPLLLCLGRLSLRNELWGMARDYLESSIRIEATPEACTELARLLFNLGEREKSAQSYRQGLQLVEQQLPKLPQPGTSRG